MTIKELANNCYDTPSSECGDKCPYKTECKKFKMIVNATIIPAKFTGPFGYWIKDELLNKEV